MFYFGRNRSGEYVNFMLPLTLEIFFILLALICYAFFSLIETSVLTVRRSTLKKITEDVEESAKTKKKAQSVLKIKARPEEFLAFVQSGSILSVVFASTFAGFFAVEDLDLVLASGCGFP